MPLKSPQLDTSEECCPSGPSGAMDPTEAERLARMFKALADPTRVRLLSMIAASSGEEACICDLIEPVGLSQPTVSHHMKQLVDAGIVEREQRGRWAYYRIVGDTLVTLSESLHPKLSAANL